MRRATLPLALLILLAGCATAPDEPEGPADPGPTPITDETWRWINGSFELTTAGLAGAAGIRIAPGGDEGRDLAPNCVVIGSQGATMAGGQARISWAEPIDLRFFAWSRNVDGSQLVSTQTTGRGSLELDLTHNGTRQLLAFGVFPADVATIEAGLPTSVKLEINARSEGHAPAVGYYRCS